MAIPCFIMIARCSLATLIKMKQYIKTDAAPQAVGPYSQAVCCGNLIYVSGQLPIDPQTDKLLTDAPIETQTRQVLKNIEAILIAAGSSMADVVKTTIFVHDMTDFVNINEIYATFFPVNQPARSCIEAASLPKGAALEIEVIAYKSK